MFLSFLVYLCAVWHFTIGEINIPPQREFAHIDVQFIPFFFVWDWYQMYKHGGTDWFFWNSVKLTFFNVLLLFPFGVYLPLLRKHITFKRGIVFCFLASLTIESLQLALSATGLMMPRTFDVDDLMVNTFGGAAGFCFSALVCRAAGKKSAFETKGCSR